MFDFSDTLPFKGSAKRGQTGYVPHFAIYYQSRNHSKKEAEKESRPYRQSIVFCLTILRPLARTKGLVSLDYYYTKTKRHELINEENRAQANGLYCKSPLVSTDFISRQDMSIGEKT